MEYISIIVLVFIFVALMALGVPIAWSLGLSGFLTLLVTVAAVPSATTVAQRMGTGLDSFALLAIPFFILAGEIMNKGGIANRLINLAKAITGRLPGGLLYVNVIASMLFGAIAGSAVAAASAIGGILGPRMEKEGYPKELGASVNITASTTGLIIPPSNILIVYSLASGGVSIAALFVAGYIPGLFIGLLLMLTAAIFIKKHNLPSGEMTSWAELGSKLFSAFPSLMLLIIVIGGIVMGVFTATRPVDPGPAEMFLRVERETLRRFEPAGCVLFTIRTHLAPLDIAVTDPAARARLAAALHSMPDDVAEYKDLGDMAERLIEHLADSSGGAPARS